MPQSLDTDDGKVHAYTNTYYACRFCNGARKTKPLQDEEGRKLLDPCVSIWSEHFRLDENLDLVPLTNDALYTKEAYDLNDRRKRVPLRTRRKVVKRYVKFLRELPARRMRALKAIERALELNEDFTSIVENAQLIEQYATEALEYLQRYVVIPRDKDSRCKCNDEQPTQLPAWLDEQCDAMPVV